jgi:hypothetical protein
VHWKCTGIYSSLYTVSQLHILVVPCRLYKLVTVTGWYRKKYPTHCDHFLCIVCPHLNSNHSWFLHQYYLANTITDTSSEAESILVRNVREFCWRSISFHTPQGCLTYHKILRHGADGFTCLPKEVVLRILIAFKSPSFSGFEPVNLGSNGKHDNY